MSKAIIVTFERKSYTFDGKYWYGTADYMVPPRSIIGSLTALIPVAPARKLKQPRKSQG
jgi:hypothetical protein